MLVFVDESGDTGMKLRKGPSPHFVIALVIVENDQAAATCRDKIRGLRAELGWHERSEFKFNGCSGPLRERFFEAVAGCPFRYAACVLNKARLLGPGFQYKDSLYKHTTSMVFSDIRDSLQDAVVVLDRCGSPDFRRTMHSYLRRKTSDHDGQTPIKHVRAEDSHKEDLLQLADMVAGAVARHYKADKTDGRIYRALIKRRELRVLFWPR